MWWRRGGQRNIGGGHRIALHHRIARAGKKLGVATQHVVGGQRRNGNRRLL